MCLALLIFAAPITSISPYPVLVLQSDARAPRSGLLQALRIQQVRFLVVDASTPPLAQETPPAFQLLDKHAALLAVWFERREAELFLHIAGRRAGEPFVDQMRFDAGDEPAMDRAFALKIRDVLDELMIARLSLSLPDIGPPPAAARVRPRVARGRPRVERGPDWVLELGGRGMGGQGRGGGRAAVVLSGARQTHLHRGAAVEVYTELALAPGTTITSAGGDITTSTVAGMLGLRVLAPALRPPQGQIDGGAYLGAGARLARASGTTPEGTTGSAQRMIPMLATGIEGRVRISPWLAVRVAMGGAMSLRRQRFAVNEVPVVDLGRYQAQGQLSLLLSLP